MKREMSDLISGLYPEFLVNLQIPTEITKGGACVGADINLFFSENIVEIIQARELCASCPRS